MLSPAAQNNLHKFLADFFRSPKYADKLKERQETSNKVEQAASTKESA